jgi:hypothetical protein
VLDPDRGELHVWLDIGGVVLVPSDDRVSAHQPQSCMENAPMSIRNKMRPVSRDHGEQARCGLCGNTTKLVKTDCCDQWICDDADQYVLFSYARNSCARNHDRYTLCGYHYNEGHKGDWRTCQRCAKDFETEMYVWYGTNEYNFVKLENPPAYQLTRCTQCHQVIKLGEDGYTKSSDGYLCERCSGDLFSLLTPKSGKKRR